jgi:Domain of unknown function (DUF5615)
MHKLVSDENFNGTVLRGLMRHYPEFDVVRVQDVGLVHTPDPEILEWAANENRILLTHDHETIPGFANDRVRAGLAMPGVFAVNDRCGIGAAIQAIAMAVIASFDDEWKDQVLFLPLK